MSRSWSEVYRILVKSDSISSTYSDENDFIDIMLILKNIFFTLLCFKIEYKLIFKQR